MKDKEEWGKCALKRKGFKKTLGIVAACCLILLVAACSNGKNETPPKVDSNGGGENAEQPINEQEPKEAKDPVKLRFAWWISPDDQNWPKIIEAFKKKHANIDIEIVTWSSSAPGDIQKAITESIAAGEPIDVFWHSNFDHAVSENIAEDLTPFIAADPEFGQYAFNPGVLEVLQRDGRQYALPRSVDPFLIYYNKDLLTQYGLEPPQNDWTWADFRDMAIAATKPEASNFGMANYDWPMDYFYQALPAANGSADHLRAMNADYTKNLADGSVPKVLQDYQWFADLILRDGVMPSPATAESNGFTNLWNNGQALFQVTVPALIQSYKNDLKFNWDIAPMPRGTQRQVGFGFINSLVMSKASKHKQEAYEFMKFWAASTEGQSILLDIGGTVPTSSQADIVDHFVNVETFKGLNMEAFLQAIQTTEMDPQNFAIGGQEMLEATHGWAPYNGVSAYDYFPSQAQQLNAKLQEKLAN